MTALSIQPTFPIFTDIDGQPLESGYIWIGTTNLNPITNPITVYWDAALTLAAVQPIRTIGGYPVNSGTPARLYVNSDYSIQVQNRNGSVVYSAPAATERLSGVVIEISSTDVSFLQAGTGAVTRTAQAKMRDAVSVKDFGAVGNGVADDTAAIQAAMDASSGVHFPIGTYKISSSLQMNDNNFVFGEGRGSQITSTHNGVVFKGKAVTPASGTNVRRYSGGGRDFSIYGPGTGLSASIALDMRGCTMFKWCNVLIQNINTGVAHGDGYSSYYNEYHAVDISTVQYGYYNTTLGNENAVFGGRVNNCTTGTVDSDNSHNKYFGLAVETFTSGHVINGAAAVGTNYISSRLENGTTGININSNAQDTVVIAPYYQSLTSSIINSGLRTVIFSNLGIKTRQGSLVEAISKQIINQAIGPISANSVSQIAFTLTAPGSGTNFLPGDAFSVTLPASWPTSLMAGPLITGGTNLVYLPVYNYTAAPVSLAAADYVFTGIKAT